MVRTWPSLVGRAGTMVRMWPRSWLGRAHLPAHMLGQVMLAVLLAASLTFSSRDAVPDDKFVYDSGPVQDGIAGADRQVSGGYQRRAAVNVAATPAEDPTPPQARVPTAPPVQLLIQALDVHRPVEKVGVDQLGVMNLPVNSWNAGWYKNGPVPGAPGDAVIEGHAGYPGKPLLFGKLVTLQPGARIIVILADGSRHLFLVASMRSVPAGSTVSGLASPYGVPRLTLITCTGHFDKKYRWYSDRLVLEARYAGTI
jgi:hypothetical protein